MATVGWGILAAAFVAALVSVGCLAVGLAVSAGRTAAAGKIPGVTFKLGRVATAAACGLLLAACGLLVWGFIAGDCSVLYVAEYRSDATGGLGWLYRLSGLWAGRQGSLLLWTTLAAVFAVSCGAPRARGFDRLDGAALLVLQGLVALFAGVLLFSAEHMPFLAMPAACLGDGGVLVGQAAQWGMNPLLEHWAMAVHPPTLFMGYAGLSVPLAFALGALLVGDVSGEWIRRCLRPALVGWLFLGIGIALGGVWAYTVLGWGGYWGWDAVENASLLPWLLGVAFIHSSTVCLRYGAMKRWTLACACVTFAFVMLSAYITRSGVIGSVHAFAGDPLSSVLFMSLLVASLLLGGCGLAFRWSALVDEGRMPMGEGLLSKNAAYWLNNYALLLAACGIAYMTLAPALPNPIPFAGCTFSSDTFAALARPFGLLYFALIAVCPLLSWGKTPGRVLVKRLRLPALVAGMVFVALVIHHWMAIVPAIEEAVGADASLVDSPIWFLNMLAVLGYLVASLLLCTSVAMLIPAGLRSMPWNRRIPIIGGAVAHAGMAVMLIGLIGSSMFMAQRAVYAEDGAEGTRPAFDAFGYSLTVLDNAVTVSDDGAEVINAVYLGVCRDGQDLGEFSPSIQVVAGTRQQQYHAAVLGRPFEDLFVVYRGIAPNGMLVFDVRVNPLIGCVWVGSCLLMVGTVISLGLRRDGPLFEGGLKVNGENMNKLQ